MIMLGNREEKADALLRIAYGRIQFCAQNFSHTQFQSYRKTQGFSEAITR